MKRGPSSNSTQAAKRSKVSSCTQTGGQRTGALRNDAVLNYLRSTPEHNPSLVLDGGG